jgi:FKBP-type peptidyl-prolyl cis-trans isomerase
MRFSCSLIVITLVVAAACREKVPEPEPPPKVDIAPAASAEVADAPTASAEPSSRAAASAGVAAEQQVLKLVSEDLKQGKGTAAKTGDTVKVHYTGTLLNGTKFDSSLDRGQPFQFKLGAGMVIKGWDEGVVGMKPGGKRKLTIPADKAYGKAGRPPTIPPNSPLVFEVELVEIV